MGLLGGRSALVTGGASGIGFAATRRLIAEGARVAIADINRQAGETAAKTLGAEFVPVDVTDPAQVAAAFRTAAEMFGSIDIVYLNAGVLTPGNDITQITADQFRKVLGINVGGVFFGIQEAVRAMDEKGGSIVATASIAGLNSYPPDPVYAASKHAVVGLVRALSPLLEPKGITINAICPGVVDTPLVPEAEAKILRGSGFPMIPPEDVAEAVVRAIIGGGTGQAWVVQPGREPLVYEFRGVPGPRVAGAEGMVPPGVPR